MLKNKNEYRIIFFSFLIILVYLIFCSFFEIKYIPEILLIIVLLCYMYIKLYPKKHISQAYSQLEILITLINDLNITERLPKTRQYAASPDYLYEINKVIKEKKPNTIFEIGSGVSTIISSYSLKKNGFGKIISLDHNEKYAEITRNEIQKHNLEKYANIIYSPLKNYKNFKWYDLSYVDNIDSIDMLVIDGPPIKIGRNARYPAIPLLLDKLSKNAVIILDDANRSNEKATIENWKKQYDCFEFYYIDNEKGLCLIKKIK